jgi:MerR family transcriptional regulator, mercuric resistance operon regulatory protein
MSTLAARLGIGALSNRSGCNIETIRYYERIGLLPRAPRSEGRELGFTLDQIRTLLKLVDGGRHTCAQVRRITEHHADEVRRKIADLRTIERVLGEMAAQCDGGTVPECPVIDALLDNHQAARAGNAGRSVGPGQRQVPTGPVIAGRRVRDS